MASGDYTVLNLEKTGHVAVITLNRPERLNALNTTLSLEFHNALDEVADDTGLRIRMVAFQAGRDAPVHEAVAHRLKHDAELVTPDLDTVLDEVGRSRLVISMRYHGAIAALLHGRAAVLLDYSPKMASLAAEGGQWAPLITEPDTEPDRLVRASRSALGVASRAGTAREALRARLGENDRALDELIP